MRFKKMIVEEGTYHPKDVKGNILTVDFPRAKIQGYAETGNKMVAAGLKIPGPINHSIKALPSTDRPAVDAFTNAGYWDKYWTEEKNGKLQLWAEIDVPESEVPKVVAGKLGTSLQEVSICGADSWVDGVGRTWTNAPLHIAIVTNPVVPDQGNFQLTDGTIAFAFSYMNTDEGIITELRKALEEDGTYLPEGVTSRDLASMLLVSLKQKNLGKINCDDSARIENIPVYFSTEPNMPITQAQAEALVNSKAVNPMTQKPFTMEDLGFKPAPVASVTDLATAQEEAAKYKNALAKMRGILTNVVVGNIKERVQGLINRQVLDKSQVATIEPQLASFQLSFNQDGTSIVKSPVEQFLDLIESQANKAETTLKSAAAQPATPNSMFNFSVVPHNDDQTSQLTPEEDKAATEFMLRAMHG